MNLKDFDDDPKSKPSDGGNVNKLALVPDGSYEAEVVNIVCKETAKGPIITVNTITHAGVEIPKEWFIMDTARGTKAEAVGLMKGDLRRLGFDTDNWTTANNRPASEEIDKAFKCLKGMVVKLKKESKDGKHWLNVEGRAANDGKPNPVPVEYLNEVGGDPFA